MSTLIIQLPAHERLSSDPASADAVKAPAATAQTEYFYVLTANGQVATRHGKATASQLPRADTVVAVTAPTDVSWHRLPLPKAPSARLRQALGGLLEEQLLDDPEDLHLAVAPNARAGEPTWVGVCNHTWLTGHLMALEKVRIRVDRLVPAVWPDEPATGYFHELHDTGGSEHEHGVEFMLTWSTGDGVATWPMSGAMSRRLLPDPLPDGARFLASPAAAAPAERWLGGPVQALTHTDHLLAAARSMWNLLQFELTPNSKGLQAVNDQWKQFLSPQWRPVRAGIICLLVAQLVGLNAWAWHQKREVKLKKAEMLTLLKQAHPQLQVVLDAPVQMKRETDALRTASGQPAENDMDALMMVAASAWVGEAPARSISYDGSALTFTPPNNWGPNDIDLFRKRLQPSGHAVDQGGDGQITLRKAKRG
jgi:general secretion pathway protein L